MLAGTEFDYGAREYLEEWRREYEEFEYAQEIHGNAHISHATDNVRSAIRSETVSAIADEIVSLTEVLSESGFQHQFVIDAIEVLHDLFVSGANDTSRFLDSEADKAYEITNLCHGHFRKMAAESVSELRQMSPTAFECLCAELLAQFGLKEVEVTPVVADGGIDVIAFQILDGKRIKYVIQCKRNSNKNKVDVRVVRELAGVKLDVGADRALVITTSSFTKPAREFSHRTRAHSWGVRLIDHRLLTKLLECTD